MGDVNGFPILIILMGMAVVIVLLIVMVISLWGGLRSIKRRMLQLLGGTDAATLEEGIIRVQEGMKRLEVNDRKQEAMLTGMAEKLSVASGHSGLIRYNAFSEQGSDLSFSFVLLNDHMDGVILTGIHSREQTYIYAKPVEHGSSTYPLTPEEKRVIDQTAQKIGRRVPTHA